jgi:hypothetical protein
MAGAAFPAFCCGPGQTPKLMQQRKLLFSVIVVLVAMLLAIFNNLRLLVLVAIRLAILNHLRLAKFNFHPGSSDIGSWGSSWLLILVRIH